MRGSVGVGSDNLLDDRERERAPERDDLPSGLELAEKEHVVDQVARQLDLLAGLLDELVHVGAGQGRALEQREQARERRAQLVRDRRGEACPQLLVGRELGQGAHEEDERVLHVLSHPAPAGVVAQDRDRRRARRRQAPFAVEHDHGLGQPLDERPDARLFVHHPFTTPSPAVDPSPTALTR